MNDSPAADTTCLACRNRSTCRNIYNRIRQIEAIGDPLPKKKLDNIKVRLGRSGFDYPNVREATRCWIFDKTAVAFFYENKLDEAFMESCKTPQRIIIREEKYIA